LSALFTRHVHARAAWGIRLERFRREVVYVLGRGTTSVVLSTSQVSDARGHNLANNMYCYQASGQNLEGGMGSPNAGKEVPAAPR
jgi:hypothetical protein